MNPRRAVGNMGVVRRVLIVVFAVAAVVSLVQLGRGMFDSWRQIRLDARVSELYVRAQEQTPTPPVTAPPSVGETPAVEPVESAEPLEPTPELRAEERFAGLVEMNPHFGGMVIIDGLGMELPYVAAPDNEVYLKRSFDGKYSSHGCVFLSSENNGLLTDNNNVLYGHNMKDDTMFAPLLRYKDDATARNAPIVELDSLSGRTRWVIFAAYTCESDTDYFSTFDDTADYAALLAQIDERSIFSTNVEVTTDDKILTLSTCDYTYDNARFVVHARLMRDEQDAENFTVEMP